MSLFDICHANYPHNLLRLACLDSEKDLLNLSMTKIRACYDLTGVWKQDKELLYSLYHIAKFCDNMGNHDWWPEDEVKYHVQKVVDKCIATNVCNQYKLY